MCADEKQQPPDFSGIRAAYDRISDAVRHTPAVSHALLEPHLGCRLWMKCENLQETGSFKLRGATNAVRRLREQGVPGDVATHSSGNHGAALALAARRAGRQAWVVMPENSVRSKVRAVQEYGGEVIFCAPGQQAREQGLAELVSRGLTPIPPYDHADIICGQGTAALELLTCQPSLEVLLVPVGGGGLIAGSAIAARQMCPGMSVVGVEPAGAADTAASFDHGERVTQWQPDTQADGLRAVVGVLNFEVIKTQVDEILLVSEQAIEAAMRWLWETTEILIEPSSAVVIAAIREHPERFRDMRAGAILTGGNVDTERYDWLSG